MEITKYMCTVETKNYPVDTIRPTIQRYASIRKKFNASEIANCLLCSANVTLHKKDGTNVKLTATNFKSILLAYRNELTNNKLKIDMNTETIKNAEDIEKMKKEIPVVEEIKKEDEIVPTITESLEEIESDPEDPDTSDWSHIYEEKKED